MPLIAAFVIPNSASRREYLDSSSRLEFTYAGRAIYKIIEHSKVELVVQRGVSSHGKKRLSGDGMKDAFDKFPDPKSIRQDGNKYS